MTYPYKRHQARTKRKTLTQWVLIIVKTTCLKMTSKHSCDLASVGFACSSCTSFPFLTPWDSLPFWDHCCSFWLEYSFQTPFCLTWYYPSDFSFLREVPIIPWNRLTSPKCTRIATCMALPCSYYSLHLSNVYPLHLGNFTTEQRWFLLSPIGVISSIPHSTWQRAVDQHIVFFEGKITPKLMCC